jgi:hypothetical protein
MCIYQVWRMMEWWKWGALFWRNCINKMNECTMDHSDGIQFTFKIQVWCLEEGSE